MVFHFRQPRLKRLFAQLLFVVLLLSNTAPMSIAETITEGAGVDHSAATADDRPASGDATPLTEDGLHSLSHEELIGCLMRLQRQIDELKHRLDESELRGNEAGSNSKTPPSLAPKSATSPKASGDVGEPAVPTLHPAERGRLLFSPGVERAMSLEGLPNAPQKKQR